MPQPRQRSARWALLALCLSALLVGCDASTGSAADLGSEADIDAASGVDGFPTTGSADDAGAAAAADPDTSSVADAPVAGADATSSGPADATDPGAPLADGSSSDDGLTGAPTPSDTTPLEDSDAPQADALVVEPDVPLEPDAAPLAPIDPATFDAVSLSVELAGPQLALIPGGAASLAGVPDAQQVWIHLVNAEGTTLDVTCDPGTGVQLGPGVGDPGLTTFDADTGCEQGLFVASSGSSTGQKSLFVSSQFLPGALVKAEVMVVDQLDLLLDVSLSGPGPSASLTTLEVPAGAPFPVAELQVDLILTDGAQHDVTEHPALQLAALDPQSGEPSQSVLTFDEPNLVVPVGFGEAVLQAHFGNAQASTSLSVVQVDCFAPGSFGEAVRAACLGIEDLVTGAFNDIIPQYTGPLGSLLEGPPPKLAPCGIGGSQDPQADPYWTLSAAQLALELQQKAADVVDAFPPPDDLTTQEKAQYQQELAVCLSRSLSAALESLVPQPACPPNAPGCDFIFWAGRAGMRLGAQLWADSMQAWLTEAGYPHDYASAASPYPLCVEEVFEASNNDVYLVATAGMTQAYLDHPLCPDYEAPTPEAAVEYQGALENYEDGIVDGIFLEQELWYHRVALEGVCCEP